MMGLLGSARRYLRGDEGNVTIEFVIIFPVMLLLTGVAMDIAFMYYKESQIHEAIQDVTRQRSMGRIATNAEAATYLKTRLASGFSDEANVSMQLRGALVSTSVTVPLHDMQLLGFFADIVGDPTLTIGDQQFLEAFDIAADDPTGGWQSQDTTLVNGILTDGEDPNLSGTTTTTITSTTTLY